MSFVWENTVLAIIAFVILYWLLSRYAFGPLFSIMEKRRELVMTQMNEAAQTREQAMAYVEEQKQALEQARKEAYDIIEQSKQTGNKQAETILADAKSEANRLKDDAVREIQSEKNKAVAALRSELGSASVQIASKLIKKEVENGPAQEELVNQYLNEVGGPTMSRDTIVAKRYAKALFEVALEQQRVLEVEQELHAVVRGLTGDADIIKFIVSPNISDEAKKTVIQASLDGKVSEPVLRTVQLLIERGRVELLEELLSDYVKIEGDSLGIADAHVYSTYALNDEEKEAVAREFGSRVNKKIRIENIVDPALLGGLKVAIGDTIYDGSLAGKLERLEQSFNRRVQ